MLSRVVETLYWMARYVERAENMSRLISVNNQYLLDLPAGAQDGWEPIINITGKREEYLEEHRDFNERTALRYLMVGAANPSSILSSLQLARENARTVREVIPRSVWEHINTLYHYVKDHQQEGMSKRGRFGYLNNIVGSVNQIFGTIESGMNHEYGYLFLRAGAMLERADMTTRILDVRSESGWHTSTEAGHFKNLQWMSVLRSLGAYQMYRQQMGTRVQRADLMEFMFHSEIFPRSILFCLYELQDLIRPVFGSERVMPVIEDATLRLREVNVRDLRGLDLHEYIDQVQIDLAKIHNSLADNYFSLTVS